MSDLKPLLVPLNDACVMLGLCRQTLYRMERDKEIRFTRIRGRTLVPMSELQRLAEPEPVSPPATVGDLVVVLKTKPIKKVQLFPVVSR
ncbi:MAG: helix-turn-helix domain-containing protein [Hyphomicrobium sp.]|jgi:excisionase family DNA binding protein